MKALVLNPARFQRLGAPLVVALAAVALAGGSLVNPSFEAGTDVPDGWRTSIGAQTGPGPESAIAVDRTIAKDGGASLRLSGDGTTQRWRTVEQDLDVLPSERVTLRVAARCRGVASQGKQYQNANAVLSFHTATGERRALLGSPVLRGDREWTELAIDAIAPADAKSVRVGMLLSMTGTLWFDDVRVERGPATAADEAGRARAFAALEGHLRRTYPFFGMAGRPTADELFGKFRAPCVAAKDEAAFLDEVHVMLCALNDVHVRVDIRKAGATRLPTGGWTKNWNSRGIQSALTEETARSHNLLAGRIGTGADAIGYVAIGSFQLDEAGITTVLAAIDSLADAKALVLDVRANGGGDEKLAARIAGRFTKSPVLYARAAWRDQLAAGTDAFEPPVDRVLQPVAPFDGRRVAVLQGPYCASSTEGFLAMMRALPNVITMGQPSRGASGNPAPFEVLPGVKVWASRWRSLLPDGSCIEGAGIAPRVVVDASHEKADPTLERALAELRK